MAEVPDFWGVQEDVYCAVSFSFHVSLWGFQGVDSDTGKGLSRGVINRESPQAASQAASCMEIKMMKSAVLLGMAKGCSET